MRGIFTALLAISALFIAGCAAVFSVRGLGLLFAGSAAAVMTMAASVELGKLVAASFLYRYWHQISVAMKAYLMVAVGVLMCITSLGIYGYLARAYESTQTKVALLQDQITTVQQQMQDTQTQIAAARSQTTASDSGNQKLIADQQARITAADKLLKSSLAQLQTQREAATQTRDQEVAGLQDQINQADAQLKAATSDEQKAIDDLNSQLAVLDRAVDEYTKQGGPGFLKDDGVKMGQRLREQQKPERDKISAAIEQHSENLTALRKAHDATVAALNQKIDAAGKTYRDALANLDTQARQLRTDHRKTVAAAEAQLAALRTGGDSRQQTQSDRITALYQQVQSQQDRIGALRDQIAHTDIGTYAFVARAMGLPADQVVKWLILVIVLVFDPLAVTLTVGLNVALVRGYPRSHPARETAAELVEPGRVDRPRGLALAGMVLIGAAAIGAGAYSLTHYVQARADRAYIKRIPADSFAVLKVDPARLPSNLAARGASLISQLVPQRVSDRIGKLVDRDLGSVGPVYFFCAYPHATQAGAAGAQHLVVIVGMVARVADAAAAEAAMWRFTQNVASPLLPAGAVSKGAVRSMVTYGDGRYLDPEGGFFTFGVTRHTAIMLMELDGDPNHPTVESEMRDCLDNPDALARNAFASQVPTLPARATDGPGAVSLWFDSERCFAAMPKNAAAQTRYQRLKKWLAFQAILQLNAPLAQGAAGASAGDGRGGVRITGDYRYADKRFVGIDGDSGATAVANLGPASGAGTAGVLMDRCAQTLDFDSLIAQLRRAIGGDDGMSTRSTASVVVDRTVLSPRRATFVLRVRQVAGPTDRIRREKKHGSIANGNSRGQG